MFAAAAPKYEQPSLYLSQIFGGLKNLSSVQHYLVAHFWKEKMVFTLKYEINLNYTTSYSFAINPKIQDSFWP